jgi:hypothetical protein
LEEIEMWAALKKAVTGVTESLGIEIPGLPVDLGSLGDTVATATQGVTEAAAGSVDVLTAVGDQVTGAAAGITENVPDIQSTIDGAIQAVPGGTDVLGAGASQ